MSYTASPSRRQLSNNAALAEELVLANIPIFPCREKEEEIKGKIYVTKSPYTPHGFKKATDDIHQIRRWWRKYPDAIIGIVPGSVGAVVADLDVKDGKRGVEEFRRLVPNWEDYPWGSTPSGGEHIWMAAPDGLDRITNATGGLPAGIDIRCDTGYICVGELADGTRYDYDNVLDDMIAGREWPPAPPAIEKALRLVVSGVVGDWPKDYVKSAYQGDYTPFTMDDAFDASEYFQKFEEESSDGSKELWQLAMKAVRAVMLCEDLPIAEIDDVNFRKNVTEIILEFLHDYGHEVPSIEHHLQKAKSQSEKISYDVNRVVQKAVAQDWVPSPRKRKTNKWPTAPLLDLEDMLERFVYLDKDGAVADQVTRRVLPLANMRYAMAPNQTQIEGKDGQPKYVPTLDLWLKSPARHTLNSFTWGPGRDESCPMPDDSDGLEAFNTWRGIDILPPPDDWERRIKFWIQHGEWLCNEHTGWLLDYLAHMFQRPHETPTTFPLLVTKPQGIGRNKWIEPVALALGGYAAQSVDLEKVLDGGFNGRLDRKLFAVVDELYVVTEGAKKFSNENKLRQLITQTVLAINPKYGLASTQYNCLRFFTISNHTDAIPLSTDDRRAYVINNPALPRSRQYYIDLAAWVDDPLNVASLQHYLLTRDISKFNPGDRAPMTDAKQRMIDAGRSELDRAVIDFAESYPGDYVSARVLREWLCTHYDFEPGRTNDKALYYACERAGVVSSGWRPRVNGVLDTVYIVKDRVLPAELITLPRKAAEEHIGTHMKALNKSR